MMAVCESWFLANHQYEVNEESVVIQINMLKSETLILGA